MLMLLPLVSVSLLNVSCTAFSAAVASRSRASPCSLVAALLAGVLAVVCVVEVSSLTVRFATSGSTCDGERFFVSFSSTMVGASSSSSSRSMLTKGSNGSRTESSRCSIFVGDGCTEERSGWSGGKKAGVGVRWQATLQGKREENKGEL